MKKFIGVGIVIGVIGAIIGMFILSYNSLVTGDEKVKLAKSNVQNMMQRRLELIPDLVETVKAYTKHEETVLANIASARQTLNNSIQNNEDAEALDEANTQLSNSIGALVKVVREDYPELASSQQYISLMDQLEGSVNRISVAREAYNEEVAKFNIKVRNFPTNIVAAMFGFEQYDDFEADEAANKTNMVDFGD